MAIILLECWHLLSFNMVVVVGMLAEASILLLYTGIFSLKLHNNKPTEIAEQILVQLYSINLQCIVQCARHFLAIEGLL